MRTQGAGNAQISGAFHQASAQSSRSSKGRKTKPFAIRFTDEERAYLLNQAGSRPLGAYCRDRLLGSKAEQRKELRTPKLDQEQYATLLAALGQSRLSSNLNQLAKSANMGTLDVSPEGERKLIAACNAIIAMRDSLLTKLDTKVQ
ncbi:Uncharacterised protein [Halioglobus japonicus]|nr:Uncharacterised protein [Halioglobus japonicus]